MSEDTEKNDFGEELEINVVDNMIMDLGSPLYADLATRLHTDLPDEEHTTHLMMARISLAMREFALLPADDSILVVVDSVYNNHELLLNYIIRNFGIDEINESRIEDKFERFCYYAISLRKEDGTEIDGKEIGSVCGEFLLEISKALDAAEKGMSVEEYEIYLDEMVKKIEEELGGKGGYASEGEA